MSHSDASRWMGRLATAPRLASRLFKWGLPTRSLVFGPLSLGDDLLCTAVLHEARKRGRPLTMFTARPELFLNNPDPAAVRPIDDHYLTLLRALGRPAIQPYYVSADPSLPDRDITPPHHIIAEMARLTGLTGDIALRPYLNLTASELAAAVRLPRQIAIHSSGLAAALPYSTKEWGSAHFAALAQLLSGDFSLVQLGSPRDPLLPGVALDLRGRTTLREAAAVQAASLLFVGLEGFLTHLARSVDCPSVVVHGGRAAPHTFDYAANLNLHSAPPCSPCGLRNHCPHELVCFSMLTPERVANAVHELLARTRDGLLVETFQLN
jgi:ADP-heptose:LPS heptosyltransferase